MSFAIGAIAGGACLLGGCTDVGAAIFYGSGFVAGSIAPSTFSSTIQSASDRFYRDHPVVNPATEQVPATERRPPPFVPPVIPQQGSPSKNPIFTRPTSSTQRLTSSAPRPPSHILPRPGNSASSTSSGTNWSYYTIASGDSLWAIAARFYGSGSQWQRIYQSNMGTIGNNPNLIYPGERLAIKH